MKKSVYSAIFITALMISVCVPSYAMDKKELESAEAKAAEYMLDLIDDPHPGSVGGDWVVFGLARGGVEVPQRFWDIYYKNALEFVTENNGNLHNTRSTEYSRLIIALTSIGADPTDVGGYNLLTILGDFDKTTKQGISGSIWALLALDSGDYKMPVNTAAEMQATRQMYVDDILAAEYPEGGWSLTGPGGSAPADPDITAMALQALAKYQGNMAVKTATDRGLAWLSDAQLPNGGFTSFGAKKAESAAQVIVALCELGISLEDNRFVKENGGLLDNLLSYMQEDGSFLHSDDSSGANQMTSEQGLYALAAAVRFINGESSLYSMDDVKISLSEAGFIPAEMHDAVNIVPIINSGATFGDISGHIYQKEIEALSERGIINGMDEQTFAPEDTLTRAQFAAIIVRGLGLEQKSVDIFKDVPALRWYAPYIGTAYTLGIVQGVDKELFNPEGQVTRQEAGTMLARAAGLCGIDTRLSEAEVRDILAQFGDYTTCAKWSQASLAFCYEQKIMDSSVLNILPQENLLRSEAAYMMYNLLTAAGLI